MEGNVCPARLRIVDTVIIGTTRLLIEGDPHELDDNFSYMDISRVESSNEPGIMIAIFKCKHCSGWFSSKE